MLDALFWIVMIFNIFSGVIVFAFILIFIFGYFAVRRDRKNLKKNKKKIKDFIANRESYRDLTNEELKLLEPFTSHKISVRPYKLQPLIDYKVSIIKGACIRNMVITEDNKNRYYYEINNINLFFPYDLDMYLSKYNVVEVVFTNTYAYVVNVNNCGIQFAFDNYDPNRIKTTNVPKSETAPKNADFASVNNDVKVDYKTLSTREETPLELKSRNLSNYGILTSFCLLFATILFIREWLAENDQILSTLIKIIICFVVAVFFALHKSKLKSKPQQVKTIKVNTFNKNSKSHTLIVDHKTNIGYPKYWSRFLPEVSKTTTEMDIRGNINTLLRCGNILSIHREVQQFGPPKFVFRNNALFFLGLILAIVFYIFSNPINNSFLAYRYYSHQLQNWQINDLTSLNNSDIKRGDLINISINGTSCDIKERNKNIDTKCHHLAIKDKPLGNEDNQFMLLFNTINKVFDEKFIDAVIDPNTLRMLVYKGESYLSLKNMGQMVIDIDKICNILEIECESVKYKLIQLYTNKGNYDETEWTKLVTEAELDPNFSKSIEISKIKEFIPYIDKIKKDILYELKNVVYNYQFNGLGVEIVLIENSYIQIAQSDSIENASSKEDLKLSLDYYYKILTNEANANDAINLIGLVGDISYREDGSISQLKLNVKDYYKVDSEKLFSLTSPVIIDIIMFIIMAAVALINGTTLLYKIIFNQRRIKLITKYYSDRVVHYYG